MHVAIAILISARTSASFFATWLFEWTLFRATLYRLVQQSCQKKNNRFERADCFSKTIHGRLRLPSKLRFLTLDKKILHTSPGRIWSSTATYLLKHFGYERQSIVDEYLKSNQCWLQHLQVALLKTMSYSSRTIDADKWCRVWSCQL